MILSLFLLITSANAASLAEDIEQLLEIPNVESARSLCHKKNVQSEGDAKSRDLCAEAFLEQVERKDTLTAWRDFRTHWKGTKWAEHGLNREAELALMELGYSAEEDAYRKLGKRYSETPTGELAMERAAQTAINAIPKQEKKDRYVRLVAKRYPHRAPELVREHTEAFKKEALPPQITKAVTEAANQRALWVVRQNDTLDTWENIAETHVAGHNIPQMSGPMPRCKDGQWTHGVKLTAADGDWFVPVKTPTCYKKPLALTWGSDGQVSSFQTPKGSLVAHTDLPDLAKRNAPVLTKRGIAFELLNGDWILTSFSGFSGPLPSAPTPLLVITPDMGVDAGDGVRTFSPVVLAHIGVPAP